jgi:hypothetical protein
VFCVRLLNLGLCIFVFGGGGLYTPLCFQPEARCWLFVKTILRGAGGSSTCAVTKSHLNSRNASITPGATLVRGAAPPLFPEEPLTPIGHDLMQSDLTQPDIRNCLVRIPLASCWTYCQYY